MLRESIYRWQGQNVKGHEEPGRESRHGASQGIRQDIIVVLAKFVGIQG